MINQYLTLMSVLLKHSRRQQRDLHTPVLHSHAFDISLIAFTFETVEKKYTRQSWARQQSCPG